MSSKFSNLQPWLDRESSLEIYKPDTPRIPDRDTGCFLALDVSVPLHATLNLKAESLLSGWAATKSFVDRACSLVTMEEPMWLDREEVAMIDREIGPPPSAIYPIYIISVGDNEFEEPVYFGKTSSRSSRFSGGHAAMTKLHHPKFTGKTKRLYLATVMLHDDIGYLPLEWLQPLSKAEALLKSIESQLIFDFQPMLNTTHKKRFNSKWPSPISIENHVRGSKFLHNRVSYGPSDQQPKELLW